MLSKEVINVFERWKVERVLAEEIPANRFGAYKYFQEIIKIIENYEKANSIYDN